MEEGADLIWTLVFLHGVQSPRQLLRLAPVCRAFNDRTKSDYYWFRFRNRLLSKLPCLRPLFDGTPIWRVYRQHLSFGKRTSKEWVTYFLGNMRPEVRQAIINAGQINPLPVIPIVNEANVILSTESIRLHICFILMEQAETERAINKRLRRSVGDLWIPDSVMYICRSVLKYKQQPQQGRFSGTFPLRQFYTPFLTIVANKSDDEIKDEQIVCATRLYFFKPEQNV
jgi:hypothetical protein